MNTDRAWTIMKEALGILERKNRDYGDANILATSTYGVGVRLLDKVHRILNLSKDGVSPNFESLGDTFMDVMNYGLIGMMLAEGSWVGSLPPEESQQTLPLMVYLAGPIDGMNSTDARIWRVLIARDFRDVGITCYNPYNAFSVPPHAGRADALRAINRAAIIASDVVLVNLMKVTTPAIGTIREIEYAVAHSKHVVVASPDLSKSLEAYDLDVHPTLSSAVSVVTQLQEQRNAARIQTSNGQLKSSETAGSSSD